jgi:hypothetical protein
MKLTRLFRWSSVVEQLLITLIVSAVGWMIHSLWNKYQSFSERTLITIGGLALLAFLVLIHERYRGETTTVTTTFADYQIQLVNLTKRHKGTVRWVAKTSVWADTPVANSERLTAEKASIASTRIPDAKYIVHLGYWRRVVEDGLRSGNKQAIGQYKGRIDALLRNVQDFASCPPDKVIIIVGALEEPGPPHRFGIYESRLDTLLVTEHDGSLGRQLPRLFLRNQSDLIRYYENEFEEEWQHYTDRIRIRSDYKPSLSFGDAARTCLINMLKQELVWLAKANGSNPSSRQRTKPASGV